MTQQVLGLPMYSTTLCSRKNGSVPGLAPWLNSDGMTVFLRRESSQLMLTRASLPLPQPMFAVAASAFGTWRVTGLRVVTCRLMPNLGLMPPGLAYFQNSARWKASVTCPVPIFVPPHVQDWLLKIGEFWVRVSAGAPASQLSFLVGSQVSPLENFTISGTSSVLMVDAGLATFFAGFLPAMM